MMTETNSSTEASSAERYMPISLYAVAAAATLLGAAHHVDHLIRGNHVGWPVTPEVNAFTFSLVIYPLVALGVYLTVTDRVEAGYWAWLFALSGGLLAYVHVSPWAIEPPRDVMGPYADPILGYVAFALLLALIVTVLAGAGYAAVLARRGTA